MEFSIKLSVKIFVKFSCQQNFMKFYITIGMLLIGCIATIATDGVAFSICVSVCLLVTPVSRTNTAEPIEMWFGRLTLTCVGPRNTVLDGSRDHSRKWGNFGVVRLTDKYIESLCCGVRSKIDNSILNNGTKCDAAFSSKFSGHLFYFGPLDVLDTLRCSVHSPSCVGLAIRRSQIRLRIISLSRNNLRPVVHTRMECLCHQAVFTLVPVKGR